jgi:hypothetical protein
MNGISTLASSASTRGRLHEPEADINSLLVREVVMSRPPQTRLVKGGKESEITSDRSLSCKQVPSTNEGVTAREETEIGFAFTCHTKRYAGRGCFLVEGYSVRRVKNRYE